ncbi:MAG: hypothetical protein K2Q34_07195 [Alphaproteobacteria bacterium]|nr:hypothetical protein [Alphaproteobacteria bacterium]
MFKRVTICLFLSTVKLIASDIPLADGPLGVPPPGGGSTLKLQPAKAPPIPDGFMLVKVGPPGFCNAVLVACHKVPPPPAPTDEDVLIRTRSDDASREEQLKMGSSTPSGDPDPFVQFSSLAIKPEDEWTQ